MSSKVPAFVLKVSQAVCGSSLAARIVTAVSIGRVIYELDKLGLEVRTWLELSLALKPCVYGLRKRWIRLEKL